MGFWSVLSFAHHLVRERVRQGDTVIDATLGNGNDTLFLAQLVGPNGRVYGFDIQPQAIERTRERLALGGIEPYTAVLLLENHANMLRSMPRTCVGTCAAAMFNLGYLPGADQGVITKPDSTVAALESALDMLRPGGVLTVVVYPGHPGGDLEADRVEGWAAAVDPTRVQALRYAFINQANRPPYCLAFERK